MNTTPPFPAALATKTPIRLLIADDNPDIRGLTRELLRANPAIEIVGEAKNGNEAVMLALEHLPDMVVMDAEMPGMNGLAATKQILRHRPETRVLMFSGDTDQANISAAFAAGVRAFVSKTAARDLEWATRAVAEGRVFVSG